MPIPTVAEFWNLLARSGLVDDGAIAVLRDEHDANPAACGGADAPHVAHWLLGRGVLTRWQAKRLSRGNLGPFFLGDYRLLERHDREGDALVFTGRHEPSGRIVSVVLLSAKRVKRLDIWTAIVQRTTAANATTDPMLSRTWSLEQDRGNRFIVSEVVTGTSLADELRRAGPMPATQAGVLVAQVARAVADLHARGAAHGGLSLDTLIRETAPGSGERVGRVRLLQFPLADDPHHMPLRPWKTDDEMRLLGRRAAYVAPEMLHPETVCDQRGDVYSIGAILYALVSGTPPCWEQNADKTLRNAAFEGPRPLGPPQVSPEIATLIDYLMARDPAKRYQTAAEAANAIAMCLGLPMAVQPLAPSPAPAPVADVHAAPENVMPMPSLVLSDLPGIGSAPLPQAIPGLKLESPADGAKKAAESSASRAHRRRAIGLQVLGGVITIGFLAGVAALVIGRIDFSSPPSLPTRTLPPRVAQNDPRPAAPPGSPSDTGGRGTSTTPPSDVSAPAPDEPAAGTARQIVVDDASLPWASPTEGPPPRLAYLPPGSQLVLVARPADLSADEEGRLFLKSLGPVVAAALEQLADMSGCEVADIELVQAGWQAGEANEVLAGYAVRLVAGRKVIADEAARRKAWGETTPSDVAGETIHAGKVFSFWVPSEEDSRVLVLASEASIATTALAGPAGREPFIASIVKQSLEARSRPDGMLRADLPLELESLVGMLDESRHVTLFGSPHYLLNRGRAVLGGPLAKLADPLRQLFGETMRGAALSAHFDANAYLELDAIAERDPPARVYAPQLAAMVEGLTGTVEEYCARLDPSPYGRMLVMRLPSMLRVLVANLRVGTEGSGVVINAYLPRHAGHNLALATELTLAQSPGSGSAASSAGPAVSGPADALGKLQKKVTIVFAKDTLEMAIQMVSDEVGVPMEIIGPDLQLDGITQNQSFGLDARDQSAEAVLGTILTKANPDGKLVYIIRKDAGAEKLFITTRAAVEKRGDPLPSIFKGGANPEKKDP
jgi:serine/threonine-protein kinase